MGLYLCLCVTFAVHVAHWRVVFPNLLTHDIYGVAVLGRVVTMSKKGVSPTLPLSTLLELLVPSLLAARRLNSNRHRLECLSGCGN